MDSPVTAPVNIVCMKWGTLYGPEYVNRLRRMVKRNLARPHRFMCFTDDPTGLDPDVEHAPLPPIAVGEPYKMLPWRKIGLFNKTLADLEGTALFLDLDLVVVGSMDAFFAYEPGRFCIIHNWTNPERGIGNSSVYRFEIGEDSYVLDRFHSMPHEHWIKEYRNSQTFLSRSVREMTFWPADWCVSFKRHCTWNFPLSWVMTPTLPVGARIVVFHGLPNPEDAVAGHWPEKKPWKRIYKQVRPTPWVAEHWR